MSSYVSRRTAALVPADVRAFATEKGLPVGARGRFSATVVAAFLAANPSTLAKVADSLGVERPKSIKKGAKSTVTLAEKVAVLAR